MSDRAFDLPKFIEPWTCDGLSIGLRCLGYELELRLVPTSTGWHTSGHYAVGPFSLTFWCVS